MKHKVYPMKNGMLFSGIDYKKLIELQASVDTLEKHAETPVKVKTMCKKKNPIRKGGKRHD